MASVMGIILRLSALLRWKGIEMESSCRHFNLGVEKSVQEVRNILKRELDELGGVPLFCYGTLMRRYHNNCLLGKSTFLGEAVTVGREFELSSDYGFPVVFYPRDDEETWRIGGELWLCDIGDFINAFYMERGAGYDIAWVQVSMVDDEEAGNTGAFMFVYDRFMGSKQGGGRDVGKGVLKWVAYEGFRGER
jgi:gamma-glutamylcyclotransferase (GGCT)/AIG2-like uncharacterized protein YtfP